MQKPKNTKKKVVKKRSDEFDFSEFEQDVTAIPKDIQKELDEKGLVGRWVNVSTMKMNAGRHRRGWIPYKVEKSQEEINLFGSGPSEYIQRNDLVLAVKTKEDFEKLRAYNRHLAKSHSVKEMIKGKGRELKEQIRSQGLSDTLEVVEGYDD